MQAQSHRILFRYKHTEGAIAAPNQFFIRGQSPIDIAPSPTITPYCIDFAKERILFAETQESLEAVPFLYHAQFKQAKRLHSVAFAEAINWAKQQSTPKAPIFVCGMGRSGTTLLSRALHRLNSLTIYDEPDIFTQLAAKPETELIRFAVTAFQLGETRLVLKQRGFVSFILPQIHAVFPDAKLLFLYRDAPSWVASNLRFILRYRIPEPIVKPLVRDMFKDYFPKRDMSGASLVEMTAHAWMSFMDAASAYKFPFLPIYYDDFAANPKETLYRIFDFCGLDRDAVALASEASKENSQAGTWLDDLPDVRLNEQQIVAIEKVTAAYPRDFRL